MVLPPPFGATVFNEQKQQVGIVGDEGNTYLTGIQADEKMTVNYDGKSQCLLALPKVLPKGELSSLLLPCHSITDAKVTASKDAPAI